MRFVRLTVFAVLLALGVTTALPAQAALDPALEQKLRDDIDYAMRWYNDITDLSGEGFTFSKQFDITPRDNHFEVSLKDIGLRLRSGYTVSAGNVIANVQPSAQEEGGWVISAALPEKIQMLDPANKILGEVTFSTEKVAASWLPVFDLFPRFDLSVKDVNVRAFDQVINISIGKMYLNRNLARDKDGRWSGPSTYGVESISVKTDNELSATEAYVGSFTGYEETKNISYETIARVKEKFEYAQKKAREAADEEKYVSLEEAQELASDVLENFSYMPDAYDGGFTIKDITLKVDPKQKRYRKYYDQEPPEPFVVSTPEVTGRGVMTDLKEPLAGGFAKMTVRDLAFSGAPEDTMDFLPHDISFGIKLANVPVRDFSKIIPALLVHAFQGNQYETEEAREIRLDRAREIAAPLPGAMEKAGTTFTLDDTHYMSKVLDARIEGVLNASATSPLLGVGTVTLQLIGLDETIDKYLSLENTQQTLNHVQMMIPFQMMGQYSKGEDGISVRSYALELTPEGEFKMNGVDLRLARQLMYKYILDSKTKRVSYPNQKTGNKEEQLKEFLEEEEQ